MTSVLWPQTKAMHAVKSMTEQKYIVPCPAGVERLEEKERGKGTAMQAPPSEKNKGPHWRGGYAFQAPRPQCRGCNAGVCQASRAVQRS